MVHLNYLLLFEYNERIYFGAMAVEEMLHDLLHHQTKRSNALSARKELLISLI
jgi:hypothetical protein